MANTLRYPLLLILGACFFSADLHAAEIAWETSPKQAQAFAKQSDRPLLIYVGADFCGYCRKLERTTWTNEAVASRVGSEYVPLKVDGQRATALVRQLGVRGFPAIILLTPEGVLLRRQDGYVDARGMLNFLQLPSKKSTPGSVIGR